MSVWKDVWLETIRMTLLEDCKDEWTSYRSSKRGSTGETSSGPVDILKFADVDL